MNPQDCFCKQEARQGGEPLLMWILVRRRLLSLLLHALHAPCSSHCLALRGNYQRTIAETILLKFIFLASLKMIYYVAAKQLRRIEGPCNIHLQ